VIAREDAKGFEYDWLAVDAEGFVAMFSTAGAGYAPAELLQDPEAFDSAIDAILQMPVRSAAACVRELPPGRVNTWKLIAERGVFAFDSDPLGGPYRLVASPHVAVLATELPSHVSSVASRIVLSNVLFRRATELGERQIRR
jgi:hypothetical protein